MKYKIMLNDEIEVASANSEGIAYIIYMKLLEIYTRKSDRLMVMYNNKVIFHQHNYSTEDKTA